MLKFTLRGMNNFYYRGCYSVTFDSFDRDEGLDNHIYIYRPPEEELDPDFFRDFFSNLTSSWFGYKNSQKLEIESDLHNVTHIPIESNHSTVPPIATSSNNYQIVENTSISETPDVFEYPAFVHNSTVPPIVTVTSIASSSMRVLTDHFTESSNVTYIYPVKYHQTDYFTESPNVIYIYPENYHKTEKNTPERNVSNDEVSNDKAGNNDPSIHKTVNFHKSEDEKFKLKDNVKPSNKVEVYGDYSKVKE